MLIVEDNDDARETLRRMLELEGHRVRVAAVDAAEMAGEEGASAYRALLD